MPYTTYHTHLKYRISHVSHHLSFSIYPTRCSIHIFMTAHVAHMLHICCTCCCRANAFIFYNPLVVKSCEQKHLVLECSSIKNKIYIMCVHFGLSWPLVLYHDKNAKKGWIGWIGWIQQFNHVQIIMACAISLWPVPLLRVPCPVSAKAAWQHEVQAAPQCPAIEAGGGSPENREEGTGNNCTNCDPVKDIFWS